MKSFFLVLVFLVATPAAAEDAGNDWQNTVLSESTIKKIQAGKQTYQKCVAEEMKKPAYLEADSRQATSDIIKACEPKLSEMREIYLSEKVPGEIADRHLRQLRIQTTRNALQGLIFGQAARNAGQ